MSETMQLVMTQSGLQIESCVPEEEMPDTIVFQGIKYMRCNELFTTFHERVRDFHGIGRHKEMVCDKCTKAVSEYDFRDMKYCPGCGRGIVHD